MTLEQIMQMDLSEYPKEYFKWASENQKKAFDLLPAAKAVKAVKAVKGAKKTKALEKLEDFVPVTPKEFHKMMDSIRGLTVERKSLPSLEEIVNKGGSLWKGTGKNQGAMFGVEPGPTENELIALHVDQKKRRKGLGTAAQNAAKVVNRGMPGDKPLVGYGYLQVPEEGSDLRRFGTTGGRGQLQSVIKWNPEYADPEFLKRGYKPTDIGRFKRSGIDPEIPMPEGWENMVGELSPIQQFGEGQIPGGLEGKFSHADLFWLQANPLNLQHLRPEQVDQLYAKQARTFARDLNDPLERQNALLFGQLSANSDLDSSMLMLSRLRNTDPETVNRLAAYIPEGRSWRDLSLDERKEISNRLISDFNMEKREKGGLGIAGSNDFSAIAELARLYKQNPDFHKRPEGLTDQQYIEQLMNQIPLISQKTGSLSYLMMDPVESDLGAIDRHIVRNLDLNPAGIKKPAQYNPTPTFPTYRDSPLVPAHVKEVDPSMMKSPKAQWMSKEYNRALDLLAESAKGKPYGPGMDQWRRWDQEERGFFSPHPQMYPGGHKLPRMPDHRVKFVRDTLANAGYSSKDPDNPSRFRPKKIENWKDVILWGVTPLEKILNTFKPRPPQAQALRGGGLNMMRYGSGS